MVTTLSAAGAVVRAAGRVSPRWGAAVALPLFAHIARPRRVTADAEATMARARRSTVRVPGLARTGVELALYDWGRGADVVVLAHGWDGRASQFATLVRELVAEGYRVLAFDAPAHGETPGRGAYLIDWTDALAALAARHGRLRAIVGHSFGGLAALVAAADGVPVDRVVTVAAPAEADSLVAQFQVMLGFDDRVVAVLRTRFAERYFPGEVEPLARLSPLQRPVADDVALLTVHDERDRMVPVGEQARIAAAYPRARALVTSGFGHNRVLACDPFLDAALEFIAEPVAAVPAARPPVQAEHSRAAEAAVEAA